MAVVESAASDVGLSLSLILKLPMVHQLVLQRTEEAFPWSSVLAVALPTHTEGHATPA
jgi:hypothetical protein